MSNDNLNNDIVNKLNNEYDIIGDINIIKIGLAKLDTSEENIAYEGEDGVVGVLKA